MVITIKRKMIKVDIPIFLDAQRELSIISLFQWQTYKNLLSGLPTLELNQGIIQDAQTQAKKLCNLDKIIFIEPLEQKLDLDVTLEYGEPVLLPKVLCIAEAN